jgi:hypothetical protein
VRRWVCVCRENGTLVPRLKFVMVELARRREGANAHLVKAAPPVAQHDDDEHQGAAGGGEGRGLGKGMRQAR